MELANVLLDSMQTVLYGPKYEGNIDVMASWYDDGEGSYILGIFFSYYGPEEDTDKEEDSKAEKKMKEAIEKVFDVDLESLSSYDE